LLEAVIEKIFKEFALEAEKGASEGKRLGDEYWLYVVTNASSSPELYLIQNPG